MSLDPNPFLPVIAAVDVCYHDQGATAAAVLFHDWADGQPCAQQVCHISQVADYQPGQFYRRELPCVLAILKVLPQQPAIIVIDGHAWLRPDEPGLGWHLHQATGIPVIGVAKTSFDQSPHAACVLRGESQRPLFVTAAGLEQQEAARHIHGMHGSFRLPTLLKQVDHLCRSSSPVPVAPVFNPSSMKALLLIDIQNDFLPGGALAVPEGDAILPIVNELMPQFELVVATQDWHPADHGSFAVNHAGRNVFEQIDLDGLPQTLWPVHCVQNTGGALFVPGLETRRIERVFTKGMNPKIDSYSGLFDNGHRASTGLGEWLRERGVTHLTVAGVATDYCVKYTVLDALGEGFTVEVVAAACRGVNLSPGDVDKAIEEMRAAGAVIV